MNTKKNTVPDRKFYTREEREKHVTEYYKSGLTLKGYADKHKLNVGTFKFWVYRPDRAKVGGISVKETTSEEKPFGRQDLSSLTPSVPLTPTIVQVPCPKCARYEKKAYVIASVLLNLGILATLVKIALAH